jgi:hypothetical protein
MHCIQRCAHKPPKRRQTRTSTIKLLHPRPGSSRKSMSRTTWKQCGLSCFKVTSAAFSLSAASCPVRLIATRSPVSETPCIFLEIFSEKCEKLLVHAQYAGIVTECSKAPSLILRTYIFMILLGATNLANDSFSRSSVDHSGDFVPCDRIARAGHLHQISLCAVVYASKFPQKTQSGSDSDTPVLLFLAIPWLKCVLLGGRRALEKRTFVNGALLNSRTKFCEWECMSRTT